MNTILSQSWVGHSLKRAQCSFVLGRRIRSSRIFNARVVQTNFIYSLQLGNCSVVILHIHVLLNLIAISAESWEWTSTCWTKGLERSGPAGLSDTPITYITHLFWVDGWQLSRTIGELYRTDRVFSAGILLSLMMLIADGQIMNLYVRRQRPRPGGKRKCSCCEGVGSSNILPRFNVEDKNI